MEDATQSALHATEDADHGRRPPGVAGVSGVQEEQQLQHPVTSAASRQPLAYIMSQVCGNCFSPSKKPN